MAFLSLKKLAAELDLSYGSVLEMAHSQQYGDCFLKIGNGIRCDWDRLYKRLVGEARYSIDSGRGSIATKYNIRGGMHKKKKEGTKK